MPRIWKTALLIFSSVLVSTPNRAAADRVEAVRVPSTEYTSIEYGDAAPLTRPRRNTATSPALTTIELAPLAQAASVGTEEPKAGEPLRVGSHRSVPTQWSGLIPPTDLPWEAAANGGQLATLAIRSPGARAIRAELLFESLPEGAEVRFYAPTSPETAHGPFDGTHLVRRRDLVSRLRADERTTWSPLIGGDEMVIEVFVPVESGTDEVWFGIETVAHIDRLPYDPRPEKALGDSGSCNRNLACESKWKKVGKSVALIFFEVAGFGSVVCTGQLLNDTDPDTDKPYLLTARHCISKKKEARSATFLWFYRRAKCQGGPIVDASTQTTGGAKILYKSKKPGSKKSTDLSLLKLKRNPPSGVTYSGWTSEDATDIVDRLVRGIHHPSGDAKKVSKGDVLVTSHFDFGLLGPPFSHYVVQWRKGTTEGGSSGSGLWIGKKFPDQYLVGVLTGGSAGCFFRDGLDFYGILSEDFARSKKLRKFLDPPN